MKTLIVHVGTPKAGSTSLQGYLRNNQKRLAAVGIGAPAEFDWRATKDSALEAALAGRIEAAPVLQRFEASLRELTGDVAVVSAEGMLAIAEQRQAPRQLVEIARRAGFGVRFLAVVRPQPEYLNSSYAQRVRALRMPLAFDPFVARSQREPRYDYARQIAQWQRAAGAEISVLPFRPVAGQELGETFLRELGYGDRIDATTGRGAAVARNERPGPITIEACRRLSDPRIAVRLETEASEARRVAVERLAGLDRPGVRFCGFDAAEAARVAERFAARNDRFARAVWGKDWDAVLPFDAARWTKATYDPATASAEERRGLEEVVAGIIADFSRPVGWWEGALASLAAVTGRPELASIKPRRQAERRREQRRNRRRV